MTTVIGWAALVTGALVAAVAPPPPLLVTPSTAPVGVVVQVAASNAPPNTDPKLCTVLVDQTPVASCTVDANGELRGHFAVPQGLEAGSDHPVTACAGACVPTALTFVRATFVRRGALHIPVAVLDPLPSPVQAPGSVRVSGTGWSVGGTCSVRAGKVTARTCSVDPTGALSALLPVTAVTPSGRYPVTATNTVGTSTQTAFTTLTAIGVVRTTTTAPTTTAPTSTAPPPSVPAVPAANSAGWPLSGPATGGLAVLGLLLLGAVGALIRWRPGRRRLPVVGVRLQARPGYSPRLVGVHNSRVHAIHLQLRTEGRTMEGPRP